MGVGIFFSLLGLPPALLLEEPLYVWVLDHDLKRAPAKGDHLATFTSKNFDAVTKKPLMVKG